MARAVYWLSPPTRLTFMVSLILVTLTLLFATRMFRFPWSALTFSRRC